MQVDLLCSGSKGNSCLIRTENSAILIDCGACTKKYLWNALKQVDCSLEQIDALFITHTHSDHIKQIRYFASRPIYSYCDLELRDLKKRGIVLDRHPLYPPSPVFVRDLKITPIVLSHDAGPTTGFLIEDGKESLVYITDTGYIRNDLLPVISNATYYVFESNHDLDKLMETERPDWLKQRIASDTGHMCNQYAAMILSRIVGENTREIVLAHLSEEANTPQLALGALMECFCARGIHLQNVDVCVAHQNEILTFGKPVSNEKMLQVSESRTCRHH